MLARFRNALIIGVVIFPIFLSACGSQVSSSAGGTAPSAISPERAELYANVAAWTKSVRQMTIGLTNYPTPGTLLYTVVTSHGGTGAMCGDFAIALQELLVANGVNARARATYMDDLSSHAITEYYDPYLQRWNVADPTFGTVYLNPTTGVGQSLDDISGLVKSMDFADLQTQYVTPVTDYYTANYFMDPLTCYLNPTPLGQQAPSIVNSSMPYLDGNPPSNLEGLNGYYIVGFGGLSEQAVIYTFNGGGVAEETITPVTLSPWLVGQYDNFYSPWMYDSLPADAHLYTLPYYSIHNSVMRFPRDGSSGVATGPPVVFQWAEIAGAQAYRLQLGTSPGNYSAFDSGNIFAISYPVSSLLPETRYFVKLSTEYSGSWQSRTSSFQTTVASAALLYPPNGATEVDWTKPVNIAWTSVSGVQYYLLYVGTTPGASDVYNSGDIQSTSASVHVLSNATYYVQLFTFINNTFYFLTSSFQTAP